MIKNLLNLLFVCTLFFLPGILVAQNNFTFNKYHTNAEVQQMLKTLNQNNPGKTKLHTITNSPGGESVTILEIRSDLEDVPAVFVGANFEGNIPLSTEGALKLAKMLLDSADYTSELKWYIIPQPNPDAAKGFFADIKYNRNVNSFEINNDVDDAVNEDGFDDLNGDGYITKMRVKTIDGSYVVSKNDKRILKHADTKSGERGVYKIYTEGIDNDGDGKYNEDGPGGINVGIAFPHLFPQEKKEAGMWSGETPEVYNILRFIFNRPEIAMVYTLGSSNFCLVPPKKGRKGDANLDKIKIPSRYARMFGVDASKTYSMNEVIEMLKDNVPDGMDVTPSLVAGMFGLGAAVNPLEDDLKFYNQFSEDYKEYLKTKKFGIENLDPEPAKNGSFELWAYYHLGVPSFSMNLFTVPKVKEEDIENKEKTEKENELSEKDKALLAWSEKEWEGNGFVDWEKIEHPDFKEVEVGGYIPYLETTPRPERIDSLLKAQLPWLLQLTKKLPKISFAQNKITDMGAGVYKLELYVENNGYLPYPIAMGQRNNQPAPVIVLLDGDIEILEGKERQPLGSIGGNQVRKLTWLIKANKAKTVTAKIESTVFKTDEKQIKIGG